MPQRSVVVHVAAVGMGSTGIYGFGSAERDAVADLAAQIAADTPAAYTFAFETTRSGAETIVRALLSEAPRNAADEVVSRCVWGHAA